MAPPPRASMAGIWLRAEVGSGEIGMQGMLPFVRGDLRKRLERSQCPGIVDGDIQPAELLHGQLHALLVGRGLPDVSCQHACLATATADGGRKLLQAFPVPRIQDHRRALRGQ